MNENDINFDWISSVIYDNDDLIDFDVDNNLNLTNYNNTDYFEHINDFERFNYSSNDYVNISKLGIYEDIYTLCYFNNTYLFYEEGSLGTIYVLNDTLDLIDTIINPVNVEYSDLNTESVCTDGVFLFDYTTTGYLYILDVNFSIINRFSVYQTGITYRAIATYNQRIYFYGKSGSNLYISEFDISGNLIESRDITSYFTSTLVYNDITYFRNHFYLTDTNDDYRIFDKDLNYVGVFDRSYGFTYTEGMYHNGYVFANTYDSGTYYVYVFDEEFNQITSEFIDFKTYYSDSEGLYYAVDNVNISFNQQYFYEDYPDYDFTDDIDGSNPDGFSITEPTNTNVEVISNLDGRIKVLLMNDNTATNRYLVENTFTQIINGYIDWFWYTDSNTDNSNFYLSQSGLGSADYQIGLKSNGHIQYYSGGWNNLDDDVIYSVDTWYHCRLYFNITSADLYIDDDFKSHITPQGTPSYFTKLTFYSENADTGYTTYIDTIDYSWTSEGFFNEIILLNESFDEICSIECDTGNYTINDINTNYNVIINSSQYINDNWSINIDVNQINQNGTFRIFNETNDLLFNDTFDCLTFGYVKYIKYVQYHRNSSHYIIISNMSILSNETKIVGNNGFISYSLDLIDTDIWDFLISSVMTLNGYGRYRLYISNGSYQNESNFICMITDYIELNGSDLEIYLLYDNQIQNPYLILETMNGFYPLSSILINGSTTAWILCDDRGNYYEGSLETSNVNTSTSYFYIQNNKLYYNIEFNDDDLEYIKLSFDIDNIVNENYQLLYATYLNRSDSNLISQFRFKNTDATYLVIDIDYLYDSDIEILNQDKTTSYIEIIISDDDLINDNSTVFGYIEDFTFNYSEQITITIFVNNILNMLIPFMIILPMTFAISYALRNKEGIMNKRVFFPVFVIISIVVYILGFFETWILFSIIISAIAYIIKKRDDL
ncbi:MAG: hypothetical protein ACFFAO_02190 [Candidatus Hermodarchaeota archaeon]